MAQKPDTPGIRELSSIHIQHANVIMTFSQDDGAAPADEEGNPATMAVNETDAGAEAANVAAGALSEVPALRFSLCFNPSYVSLNWTHCRRKSAST